MPSRAVTVLAALGLAACTTQVAPSAEPSAPAPSPAPTSSPTPPPPVEIPLAVVTGLTNLDTGITGTEVETARATGSIIEPCELREGAGCLAIDEIPGHLAANPGDLALLPAGLVTADLKALPVDGADLFGGPVARGVAYPVVTTIQGPPDAWRHDPAEIRTVISLGDSCPDRGVGYQALIAERGWDWVFGGGTAAYATIAPNPAPPGTGGHGFDVVEAAPSGDPGAVAELVAGADVTVDGFGCPVEDSADASGVTFSFDPAVMSRLRDTFGVDVATLAGNHVFDRGQSGFIETLERFAGAGIATTGAGRTLDEALEPAIVEVGGLAFAFVGFNEIPGPLAAEPDSPGVAWLDTANVARAVGRAREGGDVVVCLPQWWGGNAFHAEFRDEMRRQQALLFDAGCDQVLGRGIHWAGPIEIGPAPGGGSRLTVASHGNFLFGQDWSQQTQEGIVVELAFRGPRLVQVRLHPYVILEQGQVNLTDPTTDGAHVLRRVFAASGLEAP